jgi:hypothetical protein
MIAAIAGMILLYVLFAKFVPIISIWELKEGASTSKARRENPGAVAEETA